MVVVDSGNTAGDSWKYIFHVGSQVGLFVQESDLFEFDHLVPGRFDESQEARNKALVMAPADKPLNQRQLAALTQNGRHRLCIAVSVPLDKLMSDIEALNDFVSEKITGSEVDLIDVKFERFVPEDEASLHDIKDNVCILVNAQWEPVEDLDDTNEDES